MVNSLYFVFHARAATLPAPEVPKDLSVPAWKGVSVCKTFSTLTSPSLNCRPHPISFVHFLPFFSGLTPFWGDQLPFFEVCGGHAALSRYSVGVVPRVNVF